MQTRFNFVGEIVLPKKDGKRPLFKEMEKKVDKKTRNMVSLNFGVKESDTNMAFVEAFDGEQETIKTMNADNEKINIDWADRFDEDVVDKVAGYKKYTLDLGEDFGGRQEFITLYDFIKKAAELLPQYKGKVAVVGQMVKEFYKGTWYDKFKVQNIYAVDSERKSRLSITADVYYNKDCIDKVDFKEDKKIYLDGYIEQYFDKDTGTKYIPQRFVFSTEKYDLEGNERHKKLFDYKMKYIDIKNKNMVHILWDCVLIRGAETVEFTEDMLTENQKEQIELGIKTLDDFKPRRGVVGDKINEIRLFDPQLTGDFADGLIDTETKFSEFEEDIFTPTKDEKMEDIEKSEKVEKEDDKPPFDTDNSVSDDDLF